MNAQTPARRTARLALYTAAATICSYIETLIPVTLIPLPGFRLGLANVVLLLVLTQTGLRDALIVCLLRTAIVSLLFGSLISLAFSFCGGVCALCMMTLLQKTEKFSLPGISVGGAVFHNSGQLLIAGIITGSAGVLAYLPVLMFCALLCGLLMGFLAAALVPLVQKSKLF